MEYDTKWILNKSVYLKVKQLYTYHQLNARTLMRNTLFTTFLITNCTINNEANSLHFVFKANTALFFT